MVRRVPSLGVGRAKRPRNAFDLSEHSLYTQPAGLLLPVYIKDLNPHDHVSLNIRSELQAQTLKGRAFVGMRQYFASYFVKYSDLWTYWKSFISGLSLNNTLESSGLNDLNGSTVGSSFQVPWFKPFAYYNGMRNQSISGPWYDEFGYLRLNSYVRLCDMLGYGSVVCGDKLQASEKNDLESYTLSLFRWSAYQKIYQDHFLDDNFEKRSLKAYHLDQYVHNVGSGSSAKLEFNLDSHDTRMFSPRYAKYNKDLLNNFQTSPLFISSVDNVIKTFQGGTPYTSESLPSPTEYSKNFMHTLDGSADTVMGAYYGTERDTLFTASMVRNLFALDKMAQISGRAAKTYRAQMRAHYGVDVKDNDHMSIYCGGYSTNLDTQAVISTSSGVQAENNKLTNGAAFGEQGSFIDNSSSGHVNFDAPDFGVFMVISWVAPDLRWSAVGCDPFVSKLTKEDFYHPETEDLGMQPITSRAFRNAYYHQTASVGKLGDIEWHLDSDSVIGWQPRYSEYKTTYDRLHGEFIPSEVINPKGIFNSGSPHGTLSFLTTAAAHAPFKSINNRTYPWQAIAVSPSCTDALVDVKYDGSQETDPFRVDTQFNCTIVRDMSVSGLPRL